jgi:hypothetical protein
MEADVRAEYTVKMTEEESDEDSDGVQDWYVCLFHRNISPKILVVWYFLQFATGSITYTHLIWCIFQFSRLVPQRHSKHWAQRISEDNPRGYTELQLQYIDDAPTLAEKMKVELYMTAARRLVEAARKEPIHDDYGLARIDAMEAEIREEYAAKMAEAGEDPDEDGSAFKGYDIEDAYIFFINVVASSYLSLSLTLQSARASQK